MSAFTKMMGWDQIKEDASMMKDQGDQLMGFGSNMFNRGAGFLSGKGDWYDNAMKSFDRRQADMWGQTGRNIQRGYASKGAGGGFADLINENMTSTQRFGEGSSGFFRDLYTKGADMGIRLQTGAQGFTGQASQAYSKGADLSKARSDISTGLLNSAIGLGGGLLAQSMASKGSERLASIMMGNDPAKAVASSKPSLWGRAKGLLGFEADKAPLFGEWDSAVKKREAFNKQMQNFRVGETTGVNRLSLPNMDKASSMLPGGWKRQIMDSDAWKRSMTPGPPEPGAGWYGATGNANSYSGYRAPDQNQGGFWSWLTGRRGG